MAIFGIADLHLDFSGEKPMDVFGSVWDNHVEKLAAAWRATVGADDLVLLAGDHSWALHLASAQADLAFISSLPGRKILSKGNHDLWWQSLKKMQEQTAGTLEFMQNTAFVYDEWSICGSRGWISPEDDSFTEHDLKIYNRELLRLENSLKLAENGKRKLVMLHFPPFNKQSLASDFTMLLEKYGVEKCIYGHIHGIGQQMAFCGDLNGIDYQLVACDYLDFKPMLLVDNVLQ
ncbi:MAG: metallophosphoesterase [Clostridia bacterium]